jgi:hypothetical protein
VEDPAFVEDPVPSEYQKLRVTRIFRDLFERDTVTARFCITDTSGTRSE